MSKRTADDVKEMLSKTITAHRLATGFKPEFISISQNDNDLLARYWKGDKVQLSEYHGVALRVVG